MARVGRTIRDMRLETRNITGGADPAVSHLLADLTEAHAVYEHVYGPGMDGAAVVLGLAAGTHPDLPSLPRGARVYAICVTDAPDPAPAADALDNLARRCVARGLRWMGGLAVANGSVVAYSARSPRMGWRRRRVSEAVDRLIAAIRSDAPAGATLVRPSRYACLRAHLARPKGSGSHEAAQPHQQRRL